ncbi:MAG: peptidylprolyl isomerase [Candidatus Thiodiazotropha lotti]|nr:peptidylprolyl isomerase [Candidatus Thiodiazotropha lotti]
MRLFLVVLLGLLSASVSSSEEGVLMFGGDINVERIDLDALLVDGPVKAQKDVLNSKKQMLQLLRQIYLIRALSEEYKKQGLADNELLQAKIRRQQEKMLYIQRLKQIDEEPIPEFEQAAREQYLGNPDAYTIPERADARHILISTTDRLVDYHERGEALEIAKQVKAKLDAGERFEDLVPIYSEDPRSKDNQGTLGIIKRTADAKPVVKAAFNLKPGGISDIVESQFGFHIVKLVKKFPPRKQSYEQVKPGIIEKLTKDFIAKRREAYFDKLLESNDAAIYEDLVEEYIAKRLEDLDKQQPVKE